MLEGIWKHYEFQLCTPTEKVIAEVCQHMRENYMKDGVFYKYLVNWSENTVKHTDIIVQRVIEQGHSFLLRDITTGEIAAVQLCADNRQGVPSDWIEDFCPRIKAVDAFVEILEESTLEDFHRLLPFDADSDRENNAEIYYSSVTRKYRGRGICSEMYRRTLPFLKSKGFLAIRNTFTDPAAISAASNVGFKELGRAYLRDGKDENGEPLFSGHDEDAYFTEAAVFLGM